MRLITFFHIIAFLATSSGLSASLYVRGTLKAQDAVAIEAIAQKAEFAQNCNRLDLLSARDYHITMKPIAYDKSAKEAVLDPDEDTLWMIQKSLCRYVTTFQTVRWRITGYSGNFGNYGALQIAREFDTPGKFGDFMIPKPHISILRSKFQNKAGRDCKDLVKIPNDIPLITFVIDQFCADARKGKPLACMNKASCLALPALPPSQRR